MSKGFAILLTLAACGPSLPHPPYVPQPTSALVAVVDAPPPARLEYVPPRPRDHGAVWIDGEWSIRRGRWAWLVGRWVVPPPNATYSPWAFVRTKDGGLYFAPGTFRDADGKPLESPAPLVEARPGIVAVVDAEGFAENTGRTRRNAASATTKPKPAAEGDPLSSPTPPAAPLPKPSTRTVPAAAASAPSAPAPSAPPLR